MTRTDDRSTPVPQRVQSLVDEYRVAPDCTEEEFLAFAKLYARDVVDAHDLSVSVRKLDWEVSNRAKRRSGAVKHEGGDPTAVVLTWEYFASEGWDAMASTIRHELAHVHELNEHGEAGHGDRFKELARELHTEVNCEAFAEPKYWVECTECDTRLRRFRRSKLVENPGQYACGECGGQLQVERND